MIMSSVVFFEGLEKFNAPEVLQEVAVPDWRAAEARILKAFPRSDDSCGISPWFDVHRDSL